MMTRRRLLTYSSAAGAAFLVPLGRGAHSLERPRAALKRASAGRVLTIAASDSNDLAEYDALAKAAKKRGFDAMSMGLLAEHSLDQENYDPADSWLRFSAGCPALMKVVETSLINGVFSADHVEKNAALVRAKSRILAKYGLKGSAYLLEPQWLPKSFYAKHPNLRGPRCDQPAVALKRYYAPCLDEEDVLAHYREAARKLMELAPELAVLSISTNDSGAGICWCTGLYPGPNGPEHCKDVAMGSRMRKWFESILAGAAAAGASINLFFSPTHFGRDETRDTIEKLPEHASITHGENFPDAAGELRKRNRLVMGGANPTLIGWNLSPVTKTPFPFYNLEAMQRLADSKADVVSIGGMAAPVHGIETVATMAIMSGFYSPPESAADISARVLEIAGAHVGRRLAPALFTSWLYVDRALRLWQSCRHGDTNNLLAPQYSIIGDRWLVRPIVPDPKKISDAEKAYYGRWRHHSSNVEDADSFFITESAKNYKIDELKWPVAIYSDIVGLMDRAVRELDAAKPLLGRAGETTRKRFMLQYYRVAALRAEWRTQKNVLRAGSIIEYFTGEKKDEYWHVIRRDESFLLPATYRWLFLEAMDDEIANSRDMIAMIRGSDVPLFSTGDVESAFVLPHNLPELLEKKIALMEAHKGDIDVLFPNCPPETFTDPTYEWADRAKADG